MAGTYVVGMYSIRVKENTHTKLYRIHRNHNRYQHIAMDLEYIRRGSRADFQFDSSFIRFVMAFLYQLMQVLKLNLQNPVEI